MITLIEKNTEIGYNHLSVAKITEDIKAAAGSDILLHGDNGAGKTTLLRTLAYLERPTKGKTPEQKGKNLITTEDFNLPTDMPVIQGIRLLCDKHLRAEAIKTAKKLKLEYKKTWSQLSKGNKQKVRLIIATFTNPLKGIQFYDEPLSGLDVHTVDFFLNLWKETRANPDFKTIRIFSMHGSHINSMKWDKIWHVSPETPGGISFLKEETVTA